MVSHLSMEYVWLIDLYGNIFLTIIFFYLVKLSWYHISYQLAIKYNDLRRSVVALIEY